MVETVPPTDFSYLADNLRLIRLARRMTQRELALQTGLSQAYLCRLERHLRPSRVDDVDRLAKALGVDCSQLLRKSSLLGALR